MLCRLPPALAVPERVISQDQVQISYGMPSSGKLANCIHVPNSYWQAALVPIFPLHWILPSKSADSFLISCTKRYTLVFFCWPMQILFVISILSFLVLLWATVATTQHIRANHRLKFFVTQLQPDFDQYLFAAAQNASTSESLSFYPAAETTANFQDKAILPKHR